MRATSLTLQAEGGGFPKFQINTGKYANVEPIKGDLSNYIDNKGKNKLRLRLTSFIPPSSEDSQSSLWAGISGTAIFVQDYLVGVTSTVDQSYLIDEVLYIQPISVVEENEEFRQIVFGEANTAIQFFDLSSPPKLETDKFQHRWFEWEEKLQMNYTQELSVTDLVVVDSPLKDLWDKFIAAPRWHEEVQKKVEELRNKAATFPNFFSMNEKFDKFDLTDHNYESLIIELNKIIKGGNILSEIDKIIESYEKAKPFENSSGTSTNREGNNRAVTDIRKVRSLLIELQYITDFPLFQKCFPVIGSVGAGKTHFVLTLLKSSEKNFLLLPIKPHFDENSDLNSLILEQVAKITQTEWNSLSEFDEFLSNPHPSYEKYGSRDKTKLVIVLDDAQKWLRNDTFSQKLVNFIKTNTSLHNIFWLITLPDKSYSRFVSDVDFWERYTCVKSQKRLRIEQERVKQKKGESSLRNRKFATDNIAGWINLDTLNS